MFLVYIYQVLRYLIYIYSLLLVIGALLSWVPFLENSPIGTFLNKIINPYLNLFRRGPIARLAYSTGIDISPIIGLFILYFVEDVILKLIFQALANLMNFK